MIWLIIFGGLFLWGVNSDNPDVRFFATGVGIFGFAFTWAGMGLL